MLGQMFAIDTESGAKEKGEGCSHLPLPWHRLKTMTSSSPLSLSRWISPSLYLSVSPPFELPYSSKSRLLSLKSLLGGQSDLPCDSEKQKVEAVRSPQGADWFPAPWTDPHVTVTQQLLQKLELNTLSVVVQCSQAHLNTFRPISKLPLTLNHMQTQVSAWLFIYWGNKANLKSTGWPETRHKNPQYPMAHQEAN